MQKKIIVLAIAAALTPAMALADTANVTIYGTVDASYDFVTTGSGSRAAGVSEQRVSGNQSYVGLKGSSDLGGGLSAVWQAEGKINLDGNGYSFDRDTFAGLSSTSMGTVRIGRMGSPYKMSTRKQDVFADSIADNRSLMGGVAAASGIGAALNNSWPSSGGDVTSTVSSYAAFDGRNSQTLAYTSPSFSGVTINAALINYTAANKLSTDAKARGTSLAAMYDVAPFYGTVAYEVHNFSNMGADMTDTKEDAVKFGLGYAMDQFAVNFVYEKTKDDIGTNYWGFTNVVGHNAMTLNGKFNVSSTDAIKAAYTKAGTLGTSVWYSDSGAKQISVGYDHSMSKATTVYAIYTKLSNDANVSYALFGGGTNSNYWDGSSPSAVSLGLKHAF